MKRNLILRFLLLFLLSFIHSQMTEEKRQFLLKKVTKRIDSIKNINKLFPLKNFYERETYSYDYNKIKKIIEENNFPDSYNYINEEKPTVHIKNQESCGSCWAFASSTALAYRFKKQGIDVDLSPQNLISCYIRDCNEGGYLMESQFYLVKNGTVTETCMPYTSGNGKVTDKCPSKCKNKEEFKKYYGKNSYSTTYDYNNENYYDIVTLIMDQLINYGPVVSGISCYDDFRQLRGSSCSRTIYKYDGKSEYLGGHAVVIVGYGHQNSKYYWIVQNSWGDDFCDNGFAKVEFAEINIENVAFSEPYIPNNSTEKEFSTQMTLNGDCKITYNTGTDDNEESFEMNFKGLDSDSNFYYQCNKAPSKGKNEGVCNYNLESLHNYKGYYKYNDYTSLKKNNIFNLDFSSLPNKQFYFYGTDYIDNVYEENYHYYISEVGSGILLIYFNKTEDYKEIPNIYPNKNNETHLSNCIPIETEMEGGLFFIYCKITQNELSYFNEYSYMPLAYDILCGSKEETAAIVNILDKKKYPVFRVKGLVKPYYNYLEFGESFFLIADIEGSISGYKARDEENNFIILINVDSKRHYLYCEIPRPSNLEKNFEIGCYFMKKNDGTTISFRNIQLTPYNTIVEAKNPFEIIVGNNLMYYDYDEYEPKMIKNFRSDSHFIKVSTLLFLLIILFN